MKTLSVVGVVEEVEIQGRNVVISPALFDTGASTTSVDTTLASKAQLGPIVRTARIKTASRSEGMRRPVVKAIIRIQGREFECDVNLQDRSHMSFPVIIGRNIIAGNFLVDAEKNAHLLKKAKL